jgi:glutathione S-transferase
MYTLYYSPGSASLCVHQALIETNAEYRLIRVDLQAGAQRDPAYLQLNPRRTDIARRCGHTPRA